MSRAERSELIRCCKYSDRLWTCEKDENLHNIQNEVVNMSDCSFLFNVYTFLSQLWLLL